MIAISQIRPAIATTSFRIILDLHPLSLRCNPGPGSHVHRYVVQYGLRCRDVGTTRTMVSARMLSGAYALEHELT